MIFLLYIFECIESSIFMFLDLKLEKLKLQYSTLSLALSLCYVPLVFSFLESGMLDTKNQVKTRIDQRMKILKRTKIHHLGTSKFLLDCLPYFSSSMWEQKFVMESTLQLLL